MTVEEASGPPVEIWPDNIAAVNVFISMSTQWRVGMNGPIGLDYNAMTFVMRTAGVTKAERADVFDGIRIMEDVALETMRKNKK